ncbi:MAG TPA: dihydrolipoyl dehydrogenase [Candidatus Dormibacteraeota bacterium]|nr:dihydrolipoyl dehydrogenase [Candidatus Dormibacteraeota bacterium]
MPDQYDVAILGGGSGGYVAAIRAAQLGMRVAVVEEDKVGGTCLHRGCIPTKALLQSAALLDQVRHGGRFGVNASEVTYDHAAASRTKEDVVRRLHRGVEFLLRKNGVDTYAGRGRLEGAGQVAVSTGGELAARHVVVATGSRPASLPGLDVDGRWVLTSDEALTLDHVPRSVVVLGAGAVGVEFASLYRSLGADVTIVELLPGLVPLEDEDVGTELQRQFEARGIRCMTGTRLQPDTLERDEGGIAVTVVTGGGAEERLHAEVLLVAVGRRANVDGCGLENAGVEVSRGVVKVDAGQRTTAGGVFAVGDVAGGFQLAHKAMHEGIVAVEAIAGRDPLPVLSRHVPRTTYCTPQIGSIGLGEREARDAGYDVRAGTFPFRGNARALIWDEPGGFCKVVADAATDDVLGVHLVGHEVTELISGPGLGMLLEASPFEVSRAIAPHPTLSEVLGEAALAVSGEAIHL